MARLFHPDPHASCSFDGRPLARGADGAFDVPEMAVAELAAHGFTTQAPKVAPAPQPTQPKPQQKPRH